MTAKELPEPAEGERAQECLRLALPFDALCAWDRLRPWDWSNPILEELAAALDKPATRAALLADEGAGLYPSGAVAALKDAGLGRILIDRNDEPAAVTFPQLTALMPLLARRSGSLAITVGVNVLALLPVAIGASDELFDEVGSKVREGAFLSLLLTELSHGSDLLRNEVAAQADAEAATHYRLNGAKDLINGGSTHQLLVTLARTRSRVGGKARAALQELSDFSVFVVERDESVLPAARWPTLPARAADISGVVFRDTIVPASRRIGAEGEGFPLIRKSLTCSRGGIAALASGTLSRASELALAYARRRRLYGRPILALPAVFDHAVRIEALDQLVAAISIHAAAALNAWGSGAAVATAAAKLAGCLLAEEGVREGARILGARALLEDLPYAQLSRDILLYAVFDGTTHVVEAELARLVEREAQSRDRGKSPRLEPLDALRQLYLAPLEPMRQVARAAAPARTLPLPETLSALEALPGAPLDVAAACAQGLLELVAEARRQGRWDIEPAQTGQAAGLYAELECLAAGAALADPPRRAALGMREMRQAAPHQAALWSYTLAWFSYRAAGRLQELLFSCRFEQAWLPPAIAAIGGFDTCLRRSADRRAEASALLRASFDEG